MEAVPAQAAGSSTIVAFVMGRVRGARLFNFGQAILNYCSTLKQHGMPAVCLACSARATAANLCDGCRADLPYLPADKCPSCGVPSFASQVCGACLAHPPAFDGVLVPCAYAFPLDRLIQSFKYAGSLAVAPLIADLMSAAIAGAPRPDVIVAMPLSSERLRERGFNQSLELARLLSKHTGVSIHTEACVRVRHSAAQSALPWPERKANIRGAFVGMADLTGRAVAVVDDVLTSGATLDEIARTLKKRGAASVTGWIAARTLPPRS
jgi:ComF family protein